MPRLTLAPALTTGRYGAGGVAGMPRPHPAEALCVARRQGAEINRKGIYDRSYEAGQNRLMAGIAWLLG
jgi:hypothetical protein